MGGLEHVTAHGPMSASVREERQRRQREKRRVAYNLEEQDVCGDKLVIEKRDDVRKPRRRFEALLRRPVFAQVSPDKARALCICGARGTGSKELTGVDCDMRIANEVFKNSGVEVCSVWVDRMPARCRKGSLLHAIGALATSPSAEVCFIYYTGHAKQSGDDVVGAEGHDLAGAWVLSKASVEEYADQTMADLCSLKDLLDEWEWNIKRRSDFASSKPRPRLVLMPDCCYSAQIERQLDEGAECERRDRLQVAIHVVTISTVPNLAAVVQCEVGPW